MSVTRHPDGSVTENDNYEQRVSNVPPNEVNRNPDGSVIPVNTEGHRDGPFNKVLAGMFGGHTNSTRNDLRNDGVINTEPQPDKLSKDEKEQGLIRPLRTVYRHKACGQDTNMDNDRASTFARTPNIHHTAYCDTCRNDFPISDFVWEEDGMVLGS